MMNQSAVGKGFFFFFQLAQKFVQRSESANRIDEMLHCIKSWTLIKIITRSLIYLIIWKCKLSAPKAFSQFSPTGRNFSQAEAQHLKKNNYTHTHSVTVNETPEQLAAEGRRWSLCSAVRCCLLLTYYELEQLRMSLWSVKTAHQETSRWTSMWWAIQPNPRGWRSHPWPSATEITSRHLEASGWMKYLYDVVHYMFLLL